MRTGSPPAGPRGRAPVGATASIWFEIWGVVDPGQQNFDFSGKFPRNFNSFRQFYKKFQFFQANFKKMSMSSCNFNFFLDFPRKNCSFTATYDAPDLIRIACTIVYPIIYRVMK